MNEIAKGHPESAQQLVPIVEGVPALRDPYGRLAPYGGGIGAEGEQSSFDLIFEYWRILYKRKWLILSIAAAFIVVNAVRTLMETPLYTSTARIQIDHEARIVESGNITSEQDGYSQFMRTQQVLLEGRTIAERVAAALKLGEDADFLESKEFSIVGSVMEFLGLGKAETGNKRGGDREKIEAQRRAAGTILGNRQVRPVPNARLMDVSYTDPNPIRAQRIANAFSDAFIAANIDKRFQANQSAKIFLEDKIKQLKLRLETSEQALVEFAQDEQIVDVSEKASIGESNLAAANTELAALISERTKNQELSRQLDKSETHSLPQVLTNPAISALRTQRSTLELEYQEKLKTFKPGYPAMVQIKTKIEEIDRQLAAEISTIQGSFKAAYESSEAQEEAMRKRVATLKSELLDLQKRSIQYNILKREVDTNRELYTSLLQRYKEVDIASGVGVTNVFVVDRAAPGASSSGSLFMKLLKALGLGVGLGAAIAYMLERLDDKIHSAEEVEATTGLSVLGVIPKVRKVEEEIADPRSALNEAHRSLCTALQFTTENGLPSTLAITSAGPSEGKSITAMAIAKHFATMGRKVLLVDADLRNPSQHVKLGHDNSVGLSNYLTGACTPPEVMQRTAIPSLAFIASGPLPPNAADLLAGARLVSLISIAQEIFDLTIIDGPPVLGLADAQLLSSATSATLFIVGAGVARKGHIRGAMQRLMLSRGSVIGAALTKHDVRGAAYGYSYSHGYGVERPRGLTIRSLDVESPQQLSHSQ